MMTVTDHDHPIDPVRAAHALDVAEELCVGDLVLALDVGEDSVSCATRCATTACFS